MQHQYSTALIALNPPLQNQTLFQQLSNLRIQINNRFSINTKESILPEIESLKPSFLLLSSALQGAIEITEVITKVKESSPKTKIILVANETESKRVLQLFVANVDAIISSESLVENLESAIKQIGKGLMYVCGRTLLELRVIMHEQNKLEKSDIGLLELLTEREKEVLHSLTQGINYKQISKNLFISESTVKTHINNIFTKLNVNDRTQAVLYALHHGIESLCKKPQILKNAANEPVEKV